MPARCLGLNRIVSVICYCLLIATLSGSSGDSSTEILLCSPLFSLLPPVSALFHPDHMGSPLSARSSVSRPLVAGYDSQVSPCIYDQPSEGMWELRPDGCEKVPRWTRPVDRWGETTFLLCLPETQSPGRWANSSISTFYCLLLAFSLHLLEAGVRCDGWLLFLPDLVRSVSRWAFLLKQTAPVVNTPALILTVTRTSMPSSTVSCPHPVWMLFVPFLLLSVADWAWSLPSCWLGSFHLCLDSFSLDLGVKLISDFPVAAQAFSFYLLFAIILLAGQVGGLVAFAT